MRGPLIQQLHSLAVTLLCAVVTASHLNFAFKQMFSIRYELHYNLIKVCKKLQMSKHIFKRLTLAQCVDVQCRPAVEGCRPRLSPLHSAYLHTLLMCSPEPMHLSRVHCYIKFVTYLLCILEIVLDVGTCESFFCLNRISNRIGRPICFRIEFSNRIGRIPRKQ